MNYRDYKLFKLGNYCSVGMFGDDIYAFEYLTGFADTPVYIQITKDEFEDFTGNFDYGERKTLCSGYRGNANLDFSIILSDEEIENKKRDKSLWRAGLYSKEFYDGQGVVVINYTPYKLTKRAYKDIPQDTSLLSGFKNVKEGYLWKLAYEEVISQMHPKGTYCDVIKCDVCENKFYFNNANIPVEVKYEVQCPNCKALLMRQKRNIGEENIT